ncbi:MAG: acetate--CoA ligase family protein, partial [Candidatus Tantalella remota]|nr:acetate--CoA ligase family protein [Candidatus Tantalella remota]
KELIGGKTYDFIVSRNENRQPVVIQCAAEKAESALKKYTTGAKKISASDLVVMMLTGFEENKSYVRVVAGTAGEIEQVIDGSEEAKNRLMVDLQCYFDTSHHQVILKHPRGVFKDDTFHAFSDLLIKTGFEGLAIKCHAGDLTDFRPYATCFGAGISWQDIPNGIRTVLQKISGGTFVNDGKTHIFSFILSVFMRYGRAMVELEKLNEAEKELRQVSLRYRKLGPESIRLNDLFVKTNNELRQAADPENPAKAAKLSDVKNKLDLILAEHREYLSGIEEYIKNLRRDSEQLKRSEKTLVKVVEEAKARIARLQKANGVEVQDTSYNDSKDKEKAVWYARELYGKLPGMVLSGEIGRPAAPRQNRGAFNPSPAQIGSIRDMVNGISYLLEKFESFLRYIGINEKFLFSNGTEDGVAVGMSEVTKKLSGEQGLPLAGVLERLRRICDSHSYFKQNEKQKARELADTITTKVWEDLARRYRLGRLPVVPYQDITLLYSIRIVAGEVKVALNVPVLHGQTGIFMDSTLENSRKRLNFRRYGYFDLPAIPRPEYLSHLPARPWPDYVYSTAMLAIKAWRGLIDLVSGGSGKAKSINDIFDLAASEGRDSLYEHEVYRIFDILGIARPDHMFIPFGTDDETRDDIRMKLLSALDLGSEKLVMKIVASEVTHKSKHQAGSGVLFPNRDPEELIEEYLRLKETFALPELGSKGILIFEKILFKEKQEFLIGANFDKQFGRNVLMFGSGGTGAEEIKDMSYRVVPETRWGLFRVGRQIRNMILKTEIGKTVTRKERAGLAGTLASVEKLLRLSDKYVIQELDINPSVFDKNNGAVVALDGVLKFTSAEKLAASCNKTKEKDLTTLLMPRKVVVFGGGITAKKVEKQIRGNNAGIMVDRVPSGSELPDDADLAVICSDRKKVVPIIERIIDKKESENKKDISVIVIAGGFGESETGEGFDSDLDNAMQRAKDKGVNLNVLGPNALGMWTGSHGYSALFIDETKLNISSGGKENCCIITQSGGYIGTQVELNPDKNWGLIASIGNGKDFGAVQLLKATLDLRPEIDDIDIYLEGLKPGEGRLLCELVSRARREGKKVKIYLTEKTDISEGSAASHTASMLPQREIAVYLLKRAGAEIAIKRADTPFDQEGLKLKITPTGPIGSIGMVTNTGIESVTVGESEGSVLLEQFDSVLRDEFGSLVPDIGTIRNPLDITGAGTDDDFINSAKAMLNSESIDALILSVALHSPGIKHTIQESEIKEGSFIHRVVELVKASPKPVVLAIPSGRDAWPAVFDYLD